LDIKKELNERKRKERRFERIMTERIKYGKGSMRMVGVYVNKDLKKILKALRE